jgi:hypothetical protein
MSGSGKREQLKAEKEADLVVQSLRAAGEAAVATTLAGITSVLSNNRPLMYHIYALLHNEEWKHVLMESALGNDGDETTPTPNGDKPANDIKIRKGLNKFEQLKR